MKIDQAQFEKVYPMPKHCICVGNKYAPTEYQAWNVLIYQARWEAWQSAKNEARLVDPEYIFQESDAQRMVDEYRRNEQPAEPADIERTPAMHDAVRKVLKHHGLTKVGDGVVEADLIEAVLRCISIIQPAVPDLRELSDREILDAWDGDPVKGGRTIVDKCRAVVAAARSA